MWMDGWMAGWVDGWMGEWLDGWMVEGRGWKDGQQQGQILKKQTYCGMGHFPHGPPVLLPSASGEKHLEEEPAGMSFLSFWLRRPHRGAWLHSGEVLLTT